MKTTSSPSLDLVLVNPGSRLETYQSLGETLSAVEPPLWICLMADFARRRGLSVRIIDANAEGLGPKAVAERIHEMNPVLAAVVVYGHHPSASTQVMPASSAICAAIKSRHPERKVILAGGHVAALPERTMKEEQADFVCTGEGPVTLMDLVQALRTAHPDLSRVPGLGYRKGREIRFTPPAPLLQDLDAEMPGFSWDLLPMDRYRAHNWHALGSLKREPYASIYTTLGCPYRCTFCCIHAPFKEGEKAVGMKASVNSYRLWSPATVLGQIDILVHRYGVRNLKIADEIFVLNPRHVDEICNGIIERKYDLNIWAYARVDTVRDETLDRLRRAGITWLAFGIEAAAERVRADVRKGYDQEDIFRTLDKVRAADINIIGNYIFGLPEDDLQSMQATLDLSLELNCEFANFYCAMAYPGSALYGEAIRNGWPLPASWSGYSQHSKDTLPLPTRHLSAAEVLRFRDDAFQSYFTNARYLEMMGRKFGPRTVEHLRRMASHKLIRHHAPAAPPAPAN